MPSTTRSYRAVPRFLVWAALAAFTLYVGIRIAAGPGRDSMTFKLEWTTGPIVQVLLLTAVLAGLFAWAAVKTFRGEIAAPPQGMLRITGARINAFGEFFLTLVGGVLLLAATYMLLALPEVLLASNTEQYKHYASASPTPHILIGAMFGGFGFVLMILRRYVWEALPGQPLRRYWSRAFARAHVVAHPLDVYWSHFYVKRGIERIPAAHWLRAADPKSRGFFRDADLALLPLDTPQRELAAIADAWRARLARHATAVAPAMQAGPALRALGVMLVAIVIAVSGCSKDKPQRPPRFLFKSYVAEVEITVQSQRVKLEPSGYDSSFGGYIDMPAGTKADDIQPSITLPTACGTATPKKIDRRAPNESNVIEIRIDNYDLPSSFDVVLAPNLPAVTIGARTIDANTKRTTLYGECAFDIKIGADAFPVAQRPANGKTLFVAGKPQSCYRSGVATWSRRGAECGGESRSELQGAAAYWLEQPIYYAFEHVPTMIETFKQDCEYRAFVDRC